MLSPYVMAAVGVRLTGLLAAVAAAVLLARLLRNTPHPAAGAYLGAFFALPVAPELLFRLGGRRVVDLMLTIAWRAP
ncbi:MAG: hypothetical protein ABR614_13575, partial [Mycobacteriales bacterium]